MGFNVSVLVPGIAAAGVPAASRVPANSRVMAAAGPLSVQADVVQFSIPAVGAWILGSSRVSVMGIPVIHLASTGTAAPPPPATPVPMLVTQGDPRVQAM